MGLVVLVVDDEPDLREIIGMSLAMKGFEPVYAESGQKALALLETTKVDIILSDIRMPDGDGIDMLKKIKAKGINIPLIFMTGYADVSAADVRALGASQLIPKPFDIDEVFQAIEKIKEEYFV